VEFRFVSPETASLKFQKVVLEEAEAYLNTKASPASAKSFLQFTHLVREIRVKGLGCIYAMLRGSIATRYFAEFGSLYASRGDQQFVAMVDSGEYARLPNLDIFKEKLLYSEGYRDYCSKMLKQL
jgi:carbonic anhydrase